MPAEPMLHVEGVSKRFAGVTVIEDVSFQIPRGGRTALIGPNGAGKTTMFNLICGVFALDAGEIRLDGRRIDREPTRARVRAGLARSFQNIRLMPHLSVVENVMLGQHSAIRSQRELLSPIGWMPGSAARARAIDSLRRSGVDADPDGPVHNLPYGTRKRIEVARALMSEPRLLMLDEPAAGLNPRETADLLAFLKSIVESGLTLLVVEHDMGFVRGLCDHVVVLNFGRRIYDGATADVQHDPLVREAYLGSKAAGTTRGDHAA
jgi:branched-chain amino acid transport system ATP-binding protein